MDKEKVNIGRLEADLVNKLDSYSKLVGSSRIGIIRQLLEDFLEDKVVEPTFITLDKPFYFNYAELVSSGSVKASTIKPISNLEDVAIIKKVPVNLDKFEPEFKTYCYNKQPNLHKGIYIYHKLYWNVYFIDKVVDDFLIFQYDLKANELEIGLVKNIDLLDLYVDDNSEENKELLKGLLEEAEVFTKTINDNDVYGSIEFGANIDSVFKSFEVIEPYSQKRRLTNQLDLNKEIESYLLNNNPDSEVEEITSSDLITVLKSLMQDKKLNEEMIETLLEDSNSMKQELKKVDNIIDRLNKLEYDLEDNDKRLEVWQELKEQPKE